MPKCINCGKAKPAAQFGSQPRRASGLDPRCKPCIAEQVKKSIRMNRQLPRYKKLVKTWSAKRLVSEIEWLEIKRNAVQEELAKRA